MSSSDFRTCISLAHSESWQDEIRLGLNGLLKSSRLQLYYLGGLLLQRGVPFLFMPMLIRLYGQQVYALYLLFYSTVQLGGIFSSLAVPLSPIAFWSRVERKQQLVLTSTVLIAVLLTAIGSILAIPLFQLYRRMFAGFEVGWLTILGLIYIAQYAVSQFLVSLHRAMDSSKCFFGAQLLGAIALAWAALFNAAGASLIRLVLAFLASLCLQNCFLLISSADLYGNLRKGDINRGLARNLLAYSAPLVLYTGAGLFMYWIDKFLVKLHFDIAHFSTFSITFQYAFAQAFLAQVLGFYTFPAICRIIANESRRELKRFLLTYNTLIVICGVIYAAVIFTINGWIYPLHIERVGFAMLCAAFVSMNLSANYVNTLYALHRTVFVAIVGVCSAVELALLIAISCRLQYIELCYLSHLVVSFGILAGLWWGCRHYAKPSSEFIRSYAVIETGGTR